MNVGCPVATADWPHCFNVFRLLFMMHPPCGTMTGTCVQMYVVCDDHLHARTGLRCVNRDTSKICIFMCMYACLYSTSILDVLMYVRTYFCDGPH
jgi:hypothetical protein